MRLSQIARRLCITQSSYGSDFSNAFNVFDVHILSGRSYANGPNGQPAKIAAVQLCTEFVPTSRRPAPRRQWTGLLEILPENNPPIHGSMEPSNKKNPIRQNERHTPQGWEAVAVKALSNRASQWLTPTSKAKQENVKVRQPAQEGQTGSVEVWEHGSRTTAPKRAGRRTPRGGGNSIE